MAKPRSAIFMAENLTRYLMSVSGSNPIGRKAPSPTLGSADGRLDPELEGCTQPSYVAIVAPRLGLRLAATITYANPPSQHGMLARTNRGSK